MDWHMIEVIFAGLTILGGMMGFWMKGLNRRFDAITEILKEHNEILKEHNEVLRAQGERIARMEGTLYRLYYPEIRTGTKE